ncbi:hypothetical protein ACS0PU_010297 [Formica fusca]
MYRIVYVISVLCRGKVRQSSTRTGPAYYKRSAGAGAIQLGGDADLQSERVSVPESKRKSQFGRSSRTGQICRCWSSRRRCPPNSLLGRAFASSNHLPRRFPLQSIFHFPEPSMPIAMVKRPMTMLKRSTKMIVKKPLR